MTREKNIVPRSFFRLPNLWDEMESRVGQWMGVGKETGITVYEDEQNLFVEAQVPGLKASDVDISLDKNVLWIKGDRKVVEEDKEKKFYRQASNSFFYQVELPAAVDEDSALASIQDGLLKITFKKILKNPARKISIKRQESSHGPSQQIDIKK